MLGHGRGFVDWLVAKTGGFGLVMMNLYSETEPYAVTYIGRMIGNIGRLVYNNSIIDNAL